jgi:hypothetical protein
MGGTLRTVVVAIVVALVTAGGSTAAFVVTSKTIKNGTIQLVDINPQAKKALRGQRGPRGPRGIDELTVVVSSPPPTVILPGQSGAAEVSCPAGQQPISGGFAQTGATITGSVPDLSRRRWLVFGRNDTTTVQPLTAVAYCAENVNVIPLGTP